MQASGRHSATESRCMRKKKAVVTTAFFLLYAIFLEEHLLVDQDTE